MDKTERRQQILTFARDVFAQRGYHAAKIDDIVAAAGVARGTFYLYFEDKHAIFEEIVDHAFIRLREAIVHVDPHNPARSVEDQVRENIRRILGTFLADKATTKILVSDAVGLDPEIDRKLLSFYEEVATLLELSLKAGQALGVVVPGDARILSYLTLGAIKELLYQAVMRGWSQSVEQLAEELFRFLRVGYLRVETP